MSEKGVTDFVLERKRVENYTLILKNWSTLFSRHGLRGFMVKTIEGESTKANDLSHIL